MLISRFIKKSLCAALSIAILFAFSACTETNDVFTQTEDENLNSVSETEYTYFTQTEDGNLVSASGTEYEFLAREGSLYYFGDLIFQGSVEGEEKTSQHMGHSYQTGLFSIENDETHNILIRRAPNDEWFSIYRKTSLPPFDFSVDNCIRLEFISGGANTENKEMHTTCGDGISSKSEIAEFLADIRSQKSPREAGLYDLVTKPNGLFENCYYYTGLYGFFEDEPNLVICMTITSYNDLAYSVSIEGEDYVLPEAWLQRLQNN